MSQVSLDAIDFASDVERLLAEQVVYLRDRLTAECRETEARSSVVIAELRERISDKDQLIAILQEDVRVLRGRA